MLRNVAQIISIIFHPLLVITYILIILLMVNPQLFGVNEVMKKSPLILKIFFTSFLIPAFAVVMMKFLDLVSSFDLKERTDRIGPYIIAGVFYMWIFRTLVDNPVIPLLYKIFVLGATIALFLCFFINLFSKISAHAAGMGGFVGMIILTMIYVRYNDFSIELGSYVISITMNTLLMISIILTGIVGSARLILKAHDLKDLAGGFLVGISTQFIALYFLAV